MKDSFFIVIPAFNEEKHIDKVIKDVKKYLTHIVVVDDGSSDKTAEIATANNVTVLSHVVNLGKGVALSTGFDYGFKKGWRTGIMFDADGQHFASDLLKFFKAINNGASIVLGYRTFTYKQTWIRTFLNKVASRFISLTTNKKFRDLTCGFRAINKNIYSKIKWESKNYGIETEMIIKIAKNKLNYQEVPVEVVYHDKYKGVTVFDSLQILIGSFFWLLSKSK